MSDGDDLPEPTPEPSDELGGKPGKWDIKAPSGKVEHEEKADAKDHKVGWGDRAPKPEDTSKPKEPSKPKVELAVKPIYQKQYADLVWKTTQEGAEDKTYAEVMTAKASAEALGAAYDAKAKQAKVTIFKAKAEATAAHAQVDLIEAIGNFLFGKEAKPVAAPSAAMAPMAARVTDLTTHGTPFLPGPGSANVFVGGLPALRATLDQMLCAAPGAAPHGGGPAMVGAPTVLINGMPAIRVGDFVTEPTGGPNLIVKGCETVFIGAAAPPPAPPSVADVKPDELPWVIFESVAKGDLGTAEAEAKAEAKADLKKMQGSAAFQLGASAAAAKAELPLKVRVRVPFTSAYLGLGVTAAGTLGSVGAEAGASVKVNEVDQDTGKKTWFGTSAGAGAHAGVGGASVKLSIDLSSK